MKCSGQEKGLSQNIFLEKSMIFVESLSPRIFHFFAGSLHYAKFSKGSSYIFL